MLARRELTEREARAGGRGAASLQAGIALLATIGLTLGLYLLPAPWGWRLAYPLLLLSTYAHEMCHGVAALVVGGHFESFRMWPDASGIATLATSGTPVARAVTSAGGLLGPAVFAAVLFGFACRPRLARVGLALLGLALVVSDVLVVRNGFGVVYVGAAGALMLALAFWLAASWARGVVLFVAAQLALAVFSRADYLFTRVAKTSGGEIPSDVEAIAQALGPPYFVWGIVCGGLSILVLWAGVWLFLRTNQVD